MKKILISLLAVAVIAGGWYFLKHRNAPAAEEEAAKPAAKVETAVLKEQAIAQSIEVFGVVGAAPSGEHTFPAPFESIIRKINVSVGSTVTAGDVLMAIEPSPGELLLLKSAHSVQTLAEKSLAATQERYDLKLATSQDLLAAQQTLEDSRFKAASLEVRGIADNHAIVAVGAGVVSKLELSVGSQVPTGTALITVSGGTHLEVRLGIEAAEVGAVAAGQTVTLESSNRAEAEKISAIVRTVGASLDPATGAAEVRVAVPAGATLLLGEHVRAEIEIKKKASALVVPRSAVLPDDEKQILFTVVKGKAVKHEVKTGLTTDELVEVIGDGLHAGDVVVTLGNYELEDGMAVESAEKKEDAKEAKP